jgi:hypothetical protein
MNRLPIVLCGLLLAVLPSTSALADTTYTYTGNPFNTLNGVYTTSDFVSGSFTVATPLAPDTPYGAITPGSFSFSDGHQTLDASNTSTAFFGVATDDTGNIVGWYIALIDAEANIQTSNPYINGIVDDARIDVDSSFSRAFLFSDPGTWTESTTDPVPTPEPSSLVLLGSGLIGIAGAVRHGLVS